MYIDTMEYYSAMRKKETLLSETWMGPEDTMLSEISETKKDKQCMISLISGI